MVEYGPMLLWQCQCKEIPADKHPYLFLRCLWDCALKHGASMKVKINGGKWEGDGVFRHVHTLTCFIVHPTKSCVVTSVCVCGRNGLINKQLGVGTSQGMSTTKKST